jgi:hypothetical protein
MSGIVRKTLGHVHRSTVARLSFGSNTQRKVNNMKSTAKATKQPKAKATNGRRSAAPKVEKPEADTETSDRLPSSLEELKATKGGLVSFLFLSGKDKEVIANELKAAFKLSDVQALKITRRITGRARFFQRALELTATK